MTRASLIKKIRKAVGAGEAKTARGVTTLFFVKGQAQFDLALEYLIRAIGVSSSDAHRRASYKWSIETSDAGVVKVITWDPDGIEDDFNLVDVSYPLQEQDGGR